MKQVLQLTSGVGDRYNLDHNGKLLIYSPTRTDVEGNPEIYWPSNWAGPPAETLAEPASGICVIGEVLLDTLRFKAPSYQEVVDRITFCLGEGSITEKPNYFALLGPSKIGWQGKDMWTILLLN